MATWTFVCNRKKNEFGEFVVKAYRDGKRYTEADYLTEDLDDAIATMHALRDRTKPREISKVSMKK